MTADPLPLDVLRTERENIVRQKAERQTQFDADKAAFDADMKKFDAQLAELEIAKRVWQRLSGQTSPTLNGHDRKAEPEPPEADEDEAGEAEPEPSYRTHKEMVLDAVRAIGARGVMRNQIEQWIKNTYNVAVPPPSISTYLKRLRDDGLVRNPGDGLSWHPAGGPAR